AFAVTDSHTVGDPSSPSVDGPSSRTGGDVVVQTDVVEPLDSVHDPFSLSEVLEEKQARRLGYAIKEYFGVEFASDVLIHAAKHGATVHDVAKRILEARQALSAYSLSTIKP
ncbi:hypothetical protein IWW35_006028, partial [Coemansia sp. RSA 1878]